jgi:SHS2 domain-containing protein
MNCFRLLEHTADMGIEAQGEDLATLFRQTALGLRQIITSCTDIQPQQEFFVEVQARDREELLINWLSELLFLFEVWQLLPAEFVIDSIDDCRLQAWVRGESLDFERHYLEREVKAVTYHQIKVEQVVDGWRAQVFVDL